MGTQLPLPGTELNSGTTEPVGTEPSGTTGKKPGTKRPLGTKERSGTRSKKTGTKAPSGTQPSTVAQVDALIASVRALRVPGISQAETLKLVKEERALLKVRADVVAKNELRDDSIVRQHPAWHRLRDLILSVLSKHPEAQADVLRALESEQAR